MKILKIEDKKGLYSIDGSQYNSIIDISKEEILTILDIIYQSDDIQIDELNESEVIVNKVEKLIYENLLIQLRSFIQNKESLRGEIEDEFKDVLEKYKAELS